MATTYNRTIICNSASITDNMLKFDVVGKNYPQYKLADNFRINSSVEQMYVYTA